MRIRRRPQARLSVIFLMALLAALLLAACGGGDDGDDNGNGGDGPTATAASEEPTEPSGDETTSDVTPCDLVSKDEAAAILGEAVEDADTGAAACVYSASSNDSFASVGLGLFSFEVEGAAETSFAQGKAQVSSPEDVPGLGDEAYWDPSGSLDIRQGRHFVTISIAFADGDSFSPQGKQAALDLAPTALERLP